MGEEIKHKPKWASDPVTYRGQSTYHEKILETEYIPVRFLPRGGSSETPVIPAHWHEQVEVLCLLNGKMNAIVQGEKYSLEAGDFLVVNSGDIHMTQQDEPQTTYLLLNISSGLLSKYFSDFSALRFRTMINACEGGELRSVFLEMQRVFEERADGYQLLFTSGLYRFLYILYRDFSYWAPAPSGHDSLRIADTVEWINGHACEPITLEDAASHLHVSREHFCRIFRRFTGQTFLAYLNTLRTIRVYEAMQASDDSLTLLLEKNGITNYKTFNRTFHQLYGSSPRVIRRQFQKDSQLQMKEGKSV